ncbi:hypothetical protein Ddye_016562 [Dipteronia dyeriana]|uniref:Uncharacterized protein n=1 Tax=Dipteronia dyeriana TaxID=168575 RepID=A0AAD9U7Q7_9ROSI|nr:hypothetical protein Ddye_016562 [Dipteronia dyeriana]
MGLSQPSRFGQLKQYPNGPCLTIPQCEQCHPWNFKLEMHRDSLPSYIELYDNMFKYKNITIYKILAPFDEEAWKPYWVGIDQSRFPIDLVTVSSKEYDCGIDDNVQNDVEDNVLDNVET